MEVKLAILLLVALILIVDNPVFADYIWHNDEIPYHSTAKCFRGHSYYSSSLTANNTDIDIDSDVESLLDYNNGNICYYCICSVDGNSVGCILRDVAFCNYFRSIRDEKHVRDRYTAMLQQDRPSYFRQLSWRLRRTMDDSIFDLLNTVGAENLSSNKKCVPFVSQYTNCNDDNLCSGCTHCSCTAEAQWTCKDVKECDDDMVNEDNQQMQEQEEIFDNALNMLESEMEKKNLARLKNTNHPNVPSPEATKEHGLGGDLLGSVKNYQLGEFISPYMMPKMFRKRSIPKKTNKHNKRSIDKTSHKRSKIENNTIKFHDTIDELNEDTLKDSNTTGTLPAMKVDLVTQLTKTRRSGDADNTSKTLQIDFNQPKKYNQINDNKIEATEQEKKFDASHENLRTVFGNYTREVKDKELSKVVVNELKKGSEVIGDESAPVTSNITFTPENDTLTAMAFIAGNLLNKLWNMEKDATGSSMETDIIKHEKINDLIDLFKEPLNLRQEIFLKNALEHLSVALDKHKDVRNVSLCENIEEAKKLLYDTNSTNNEEDKSNSVVEPPCSAHKSKVQKAGENKQKKATVNAIAKINNVLDLIKKFENIQGTLNVLKHGPKPYFNHTKPTIKTLVTDTVLTSEEKSSLNMFGTLLEKITKLILPKRSNKKIINQLKSQYVLGSNDNLKKKFEKMYNIDLINMTVTAKDRLILDYLTHVDKNPDCLLNNNNRKITEAIPSIEGNILLNLSEFFKLKSFSDLLKLLDTEDQIKRSRSPPETTSQRESVFETTTAIAEKKISSNFKDIVDSQKLNSTKEKLKRHLKTIIEDLIELQNAKGVSIKGNVEIADALPCIYNVLNAGTEEIVAKKEEKIKDPAKKIADIFNGLKQEIKAVQSRRSNADVMAVRPKSAVVWERLLKNLNDQLKSKTRRFMFDKGPKSYDRIKMMMDKIDNGSSTYKQIALLVKVQPEGRLMLLKALKQDVQNTINIINDIKLSFETLSKLPVQKFSDLEEFVGNMATGISMSEKVIEKIKPELKKYAVNEINSSNRISKNKIKKQPSLKYGEPRNEEHDDMRISRNQIVNQLIKNRIEAFLKMKDDTQFDGNNDINYNIAQRILYYLDAGNYNLARELFKVFVMQRQNLLEMNSKTESASGQIVATSTSTAKLIEGPMRRMVSHPTPNPIENPNRLRAKHINWANQDHLIKQLLNIKSMGL